MNAKEFLSQAFLLDRNIKNKERLLSALRQRCGYSSPVLSDMPQSKPDGSSNVERLALRVLELSQEIQALRVELSKVEVEIHKAIARVNNQNLTAILEMRYLGFMKWEEIAAEMDYSIDYVYQVHRRALLQIRMV